VRLALCLLVWLAPVWGATLEQLSVSDLIAKSTAIVQGQVTGSSTFLKGSVIYTDYKVGVTQQWKGAARSSVDVIVPGGIANGTRQTFPGAPQLSGGQPYVLFLWTSSKGATTTLGFTQGVFNLLKDGSGGVRASQMPTSETMLAPDTGQAVNSQPISMPLSQLVSLITGGSK
jgi:hypothetical protein